MNSTSNMKRDFWRTWIQNTRQYMPDLTVSHEFFNISASTRWDLYMIDDAYESGKIEFPIQARMMQEEVLATSGYAPKDLRLLNLQRRRDKGEFGQIHPILIFYQYNKVCEHLIKMIQTMRPDLPIHTLNLETLSIKIDGKSIAKRKILPMKLPVQHT